MGDISVPALTSRGKSDCGIAGIPSGELLDTCPNHEHKPGFFSRDI